MNGTSKTLSLEVSSTYGTTKTSSEVNIDISDQNGETKVYKRRWYILFVYSLFTCTQAAVWCTWGPIAASSEKVFGWTDATVALLTNWGPICFVATALVSSWIVDVKGLRWGCLLGCGTMAIGTAVRCITSDPSYVTWNFPHECALALSRTMNVGQIIIGIAMPIAMGLPPALSAKWFPVHERTTATGMATAINYFGVAVSYLLGPYIVSGETADSNNICPNNGSNISASFAKDEIETMEIRDNIMKLMYIECGWSALILIATVVYFPAAPALPPTISASVGRLDYKIGIKGLIRNKAFLLICLTYGVPLGVFGMWEGILGVNLKAHDVTEQQSGWIGFYSVIAGNVSALLVSRFADIFAKHLKMLLVILFVLTAGTFIWLCLMLNGNISFSLAQVYAAVIVGTFFLNATPPLFFEMACESTYPIAEGITNFVLTMCFSLAALVFLGLQSIPDIGTIWMNWCVLGCTIGAVPILLLMKDSYTRLDLDQMTTKEKTADK